MNVQTFKPGMAMQYGVLADGKPLKHVTVTSFVDWEDIAAHKIAEQRAGKTLPMMPIHRANLQRRMAVDGATEIRLFPTAAA